MKLLLQALMMRGSKNSRACPRQRRCTPLAGCIASLLGLLPWSAQAHPAASEASAASPSYSASTALRLPLAGLPSRHPKIFAVLRNSPASSPGKERVLLTAAPVSAFGFLSDPVLSLVGRHGASDPHGLSRPSPPRQARASQGQPAPITRNVVLDSSLGQTQQPVVSTNSNGQNDYAVYGTMGEQVGGNLFFSFTAFNLATQESATFSGPFTLSTPVQNILARVTGGASSIDGLISTSKIPGANLFLLNPAGVIFGPNAQLDLGGSFVVSTADYIKLADGAKFEALAGAADSSLSAAAVAAFGFMNPAPNGVQFNGSQLNVPENTGFHVIAGNITLTSGTDVNGNTAGAALSAPSGDITLFSASSAGEVPFNLATPGASFAQATAKAGGSISLTNQSSVAIDGDGGGALVIYGGAVALDNATVTASNSGSDDGGSITVVAHSLSLLNGAQLGSTTTDVGTGSTVTANVAGLFTISGGSIVTSTTDGPGNGGSVSIKAGQLTITGSLPDGSAGSGIIADSNSTGAGGTAGNVAVSVSGLFSMNGGGEITASTYGLGDGGSIRVTAGQLIISGGLPDKSASSGIFADSYASGPAGFAGNIAITVPGLFALANGGEISSSTYGLGHGGNVFVSAGQLTIAGALSSDFPSGIFAETYSTTDRGTAGNVSVSVPGLLTLTGGGELSSSSYGLGDGGDVQVTAGGLVIAGGLPDNSAPSAIFADSKLEPADGLGGSAGNVTVNIAGQLTLSGGGQITSQTVGRGNGGEVQVTASALTIDGSLPDESVSSGIIADSSSTGLGGAGGVVSVNVSGLLALSGGGIISSSTYGLGRGGSVEVTAGQATITGGLSDNSATSGILADSYSTGPGGSAGAVVVKVASLLSLTEGGAISSTTFGAGNAGSIRVTAGQLTIAGGLPDNSVGSEIRAETASTGQGGDVTVDVAGRLLISGGGDISSSTFDLGNGGGVYVRAGSLTITGGLPDNGGNSGILADSNAETDSGAGGSAGVVIVNVKGLLSIADGGEISSSTFGFGNAGSVQVNAGALTISGGAASGATGGIFTDTDTSGRGGSAGDVTVSVSGLLNIKNGGEISSTTYDFGDAGDLQVGAREISISGPGSGLFARSTSLGDGGVAGNVSVDAQTLTLSNHAAVASSSTSTGDAGTIEVAATDIALNSASRFSTSAPNSDAGSISVLAGANLVLTDSSKIAASAGANGGDITITAGNLVYLLQSQITATAGTLPNAAAKAGKGGNITIDPTFIVLDHSLISANAAVGRGGNIFLQTENFLSSESEITATGSTAGTITIAAPQLDLTNGLVGLSGSLLDVSNQFREQCAQRLDQDFSSFLVVGQGGVDAEPDQAQASGSSDEQSRRQKTKLPAKKAGLSPVNH